MLHFARIASKFLSAAEIIERPPRWQGRCRRPGTAVATAREMVTAHGGSFDDPPTTTIILDGARGGRGRHPRPQRYACPAWLLTKEIIFGGPGRS